MNNTKGPKFKYLQVPGRYYGQVGQLGGSGLEGYSHLEESFGISSCRQNYIIQIYMRNLSISLNIVWVNTVLANKTFLQTQFQLAALDYKHSKVLLPYFAQCLEPPSNWYAN